MRTDDKINFGENIKKIRKSKGLSIDGLSSKLGKNEASINDWENGAAFPEIDIMRSLAKIFDCSIDDFMRSDWSEDIQKNIVNSLAETWALFDGNAPLYGDIPANAIYSDGTSVTAKLMSENRADYEVYANIFLEMLANRGLRLIRK